MTIAIMTGSDDPKNYGKFCVVHNRNNLNQVTAKINYFKGFGLAQYSIFISGN